jgi:hypothetical protein
MYTFGDMDNQRLYILAENVSLSLRIGLIQNWLIAYIIE